jgi:hypothetical protein
VLAPATYVPVYFHCVFPFGLCRGRGCGVAAAKWALDEACFSFFVFFSPFHVAVHCAADEVW